MWDFMTPSRIASAVVDFPDSLTLLIVGLVSFVWLSAGLIVLWRSNTTCLGK